MMATIFMMKISESFPSILTNFGACDEQKLSYTVDLQKTWLYYYRSGSTSPRRIRDQLLLAHQYAPE